MERDRERGMEGQEASPTKTSPLFIIELQLCADRQPRFKQTPPFDSMLTWRHTIGMSPNIRLLQSTLYSSTHCLIKPNTRAGSDSREQSWHVSWICSNFVKDSCLIASAGACCPFLPVGSCVFHSVMTSPYVRWLSRCTV